MLQPSWIDQIHRALYAAIVIDPAVTIDLNGCTSSLSRLRRRLNELAQLSRVAIDVTQRDPADDVLAISYPMASNPSVTSTTLLEEQSRDGMILDEQVWHDGLWSRVYSMLVPVSYMIDASSEPAAHSFERDYRVTRKVHFDPPSFVLLRIASHRIASHHPLIPFSRPERHVVLRRAHVDRSNHSSAHRSSSK